VRALATEHRVAAVNFSLGEEVSDEQVCQSHILAPLIRDLLSRGILTVAAAGNGGKDHLSAPACVDEAIA
jgi:hypothetical protein